MPNIKSKVKNISRIKKATIRNNAIKSRVKKAIKKAKIAVSENSKEFEKIVSFAHKEINNAVSKNVLHKNNGARKQARLDSFVTKTILLNKEKNHQNSSIKNQK